MLISICIAMAVIVFLFGYAVANDGMRKHGSHE